MTDALPSRPGRRGTAAQLSPTPRIKVSRDQQKARRAQELLDAAWVLFCEKGYEAVTIENVADQAGYSRQPVYTLFGDKQNLFFELQRTAISEVTGLLLDVMQAGQPLRSNLQRLATLVSEQLNSDKPTYGERLFFVAQTIALSRPDIADKLQMEARKLVEEMARMIRRSTLADGETLRGEPENIAAHISGLINGLTTVQFQTRDRYTNAQDLATIFNAIAFR